MDDVKSRSLVVARGSISRRYSYAFISVVSALILCFAVVAIFINVTQTRQELEKRAEHSLNLARNSLPKALWNLETDVIDEFVEALFLDDAVVHARVMWQGDFISMKTRDKDREGEFLTAAEDAEWILKKTDILFENRKVGTIHIAMSRESLRDELILNISAIVALTATVIAAISATSIFITRRYIARPLSKLQDSATRIAEGDLDASIGIAGDDEIAVLAHDLTAMRDSIKALFADLRKSNEELERVGQLKRFFSPQVAELIVSGENDKVVESHRREITVVFCDLRGFTAFAETAEPEEVMKVLREYHQVVGPLISRFEATLEHFAGDGLMTFFNDPLPCPDPAARAVRMAVAMHEEVGRLVDGWRNRGHELGLGVGIALGYATLGQIGFEGRFHYGAIGSVLNLASRLCDKAEPGQILVTQRIRTEVEKIAELEPLGDLALKGFHSPVPAFNVIGLKPQAA